MKPIAYWTNELGEECSSELHGLFSKGGADFAVVWDWREATRGHGLIVLERDRVKIRMETFR